MIYNQPSLIPVVENVWILLRHISTQAKEYDQREIDINRITAKKFTPFSYIDVHSSKITHILADLFNPTGLHGQGRFFLNALLDLYGLDRHFFPAGDIISSSFDAPAFTYTNTRERFDILIRSKDRAIAIENRLTGIADHPQQALFYLKHLKNNYPMGFYLIYLAPEHKTISTESLPPFARDEYSQHFLETVTWQNLIEQISSLRRQLGAEKLCFFLEDFVNAVNGFLSHRSETQS